MVLADGTDSVGGMVVSKTVPLRLTIDDHSETTQFFVTKLNHQVILGITWLQKHNPLIDWTECSMDFVSSCCKEQCLRNPAKSKKERRRRKYNKKLEEKRSKNSNYAALITRINELKTILNTPKATSCPRLSISSISSVKFKKHAKTSEGLTGMCMLKFTNGSVEVGRIDSMQETVYPFMQATAPTNQDIPSDIAKKFADVFSKSKADSLPEHRRFDCTIDLEPNTKPFGGKVYNLTKEEETVMKEWIQENLDKGFIRVSSSPFAAPCFFVKQKDKLRLCMDYRGLNASTIKNRYPVPLIADLLRTLSAGRIFTTLDLRGAYNFLRIKEGDEPKTAFVTKFGQYEFLVMPFGLANAPAQFQSMMNEIFSKQLGNYVLVYLDDIVIYSKNRKDHARHIDEVMTILRENKLYCKPEKCHFYQESIKYLGYIISADGVKMDPAKVSPVRSALPTYITVRSHVIQISSQVKWSY